MVVGPALPVARARVSSGGAGVYGVSRVPGTRLRGGQGFRLPVPGCRLAGPACTLSAGSLAGVGPAPLVACARVSSRVAGVYVVGRVPGWGGAGAYGCLRLGAVWWGRRVLGRQGPGLVWDRRFRLPAPRYRLVGPACSWVAGSRVGMGPALQVACARVPFGGTNVYGVGRVPGWCGGQRFRLPAPWARLGWPACTWSAGSLVGVGPALQGACARVSSGRAGVSVVGGVPGRGGASAPGCLRLGVASGSRRVRG